MCRARFSHDPLEEEKINVSRETREARESVVINSSITCARFKISYY